MSRKKKKKKKTKRCHIEASGLRITQQRGHRVYHSLTFLGLEPPEEFADLLVRGVGLLFVKLDGTARFNGGSASRLQPFWEPPLLSRLGPIEYTRRCHVSSLNFSFLCFFRTMKKQSNLREYW